MLRLILSLLVFASVAHAGIQYPAPEDDDCGSYLENRSMVIGFVMPYRPFIVEAQTALNRPLNRKEMVFLSLALTGSPLGGTAWDKTKGSLVQYQISSSRTRAPERADDISHHAFEMLRDHTILTIELLGVDAVKLDQLVKDTEHAMAEDGSLGQINPLGQGEKLFLWIAAQSLRIDRSSPQLSESDLFADSVQKTAILMHAFSARKASVIKEKVLKPYNQRIIAELANPFRLMRRRSSGDRFFP